MGTLGGSGRRDFTVTGKTVNLAASMEKRSKQATHSFVVVCEETRSRLGQQYQTVRLGETPADNHGAG